MCISAITQPTEPRVAIIENQKLLALETQEDDMNRSCGNIYLGTITSIKPAIDAAFVDLGSQRHGFLPFKEIAPKYYTQPAETSDDNEKASIEKLVKVGQKVLVQVTREEKSNKGAALTTFLSLAGAYLVIMPNNQKNNGISKKADANERQKLKSVLSELNIPDDLSVIVRTEGINRNKDELAWDLDCLIHHWEKIHAASNEATAPSLIHQEADTLIRCVRDRLRKNISSIVVDHEPTYEKLKVYLELTRPEFVERLTLYQNKVPIFSHFGVQSEINSLFLRKIQLPSGGSIVIDYTEAMTVIDVNSSKSTNAKNIEETALKTNLEAASETLKQLVLRDIGGIIAIDFIDMVAAENKSKVERMIEGYINNEKAKIRFEPISALTGCMYLSRQRTGPSIIDQHYTECKQCQGLGLHRSILSIANNILHKAEDSCVAAGVSSVVIQTSPDVACFLLNEKRQHIEQIEKTFNSRIIIISNEQYLDTKYTLKRSNEIMNSASSEQKDLQENATKLHHYPGPAQPLVQQNLYKEHPKQSTGPIQRFMNILMPQKEPVPKVYSNEKKPRKAEAQTERESKSRDNNTHKRPRRRNRSATQTRRSPQSNGQRGRANQQNKSSDRIKQHDPKTISSDSSDRLSD